MISALEAWEGTMKDRVSDFMDKVIEPEIKKAMSVGATGSSFLLDEWNQGWVGLLTEPEREDLLQRLRTLNYLVVPRPPRKDEYRISWQHLNPDRYETE